MKKRKPRLCNKLAIKTALVFYGNRYFKKKVNLQYNGELAKLQPPYIVLANHCSFVDVTATAKLLYPSCASFVASETQMTGKAFLLRLLGTLLKKQFIVEPSLIKNIKYVLSKNRPVVIYPEGKFSVDGTSNEIKPAIAKMVKMMKVPLVTVCYHGNYIHHPRWAKKSRYVPLVPEIRLAVAPEEIDTITADEIYSRIISNLSYDDYAWQKQNGVEVDVPDLLEGAETILYKCPHCHKEFVMTTSGNTITCGDCGYTQSQNKLGELIGGVFGSFHEWYAWQREEVLKELQSGPYSYSAVFKAEEMNKKYKFNEIGEVVLTQNDDGITVQFENGEKLCYPRQMFYTLSFNGDYVFLPTTEKVYRFRRLSDVGSTTKINLVVEQQAHLDEQKTENKM